MNPRIFILKTTAFVLGCILALQSASAALAQNANAGSQQPPASTPAATSTPAAPSTPVAQGPANAAGDGSQGTSSGPQAPAAQTQDTKESLRVQQTQEAAKTQSPDGNALQQPQGAAAARAQPTTGTAASQPAGAALAPAGQKRSRSFLIRLGILAGAGIAVGTVVALSAASPSKPPGSH